MLDILPSFPRKAAFWHPCFVKSALAWVRANRCPLAQHQQFFARFHACEKREDSSSLHIRRCRALLPNANRAAFPTSSQSLSSLAVDAEPLPDSLTCPLPSPYQASSAYSPPSHRAERPVRRSCAPSPAVTPPADTSFPHMCRAS